MGWKSSPQNGGGVKAHKLRKTKLLSHCLIRPVWPARNVRFDAMHRNLAVLAVYTVM